MATSLAASMQSPTNSIHAGKAITAGGAKDPLRHHFDPTGRIKPMSENDSANRLPHPQLAGTQGLGTDLKPVHFCSPAFIPYADGAERRKPPSITLPRRVGNA